MEYIHTPENNYVAQENKTSYITLKFRKPKIFTIVIGVVVVLIFAILFFTKSLFIAAIVNGSPISRVSVIRELEQKGGKQALESIINKKLIEDELNKQKISTIKEEIDAEIKKIETQIVSQGNTLASVLSMQGMTEQKLRDQITLQERMRKLLAEKIAVSDKEIDTYIKNSKISPPKDTKPGDFKQQVGDQLKQQKFQQEAQKWISGLTTGAKIIYYVKY